MEIRERKIASLILGVITAIALIVSQLFFYQNTVQVKKETKTEKQSEDSSEEEQSVFYIVAASPSISSVQTQIHQEVFFLFEIIFFEDEKHEWFPTMSPAFGKYFQTLFHIIISPNAP